MCPPVKQNPDCVPLEKLQLNIKNDGVIIVISALVCVNFYTIKM